MSDQFKLAVLAERDRRLKRSYRDWAVLDYPDFDQLWRKRSFAASVWAAKTLLVAEFGDVGNSPTRIACWLRDEGFVGDYAKESVRPLVYEARKIIATLERVGMKGGAEPFWPPFSFGDGG